MGYHGGTWMTLSFVSPFLLMRNPSRPGLLGSSQHWGLMRRLLEGGCVAW